MSEPIDLLLQRNSAPRLTLPSPDPQEQTLMFQAALRAPDHLWLRPWRFLVVEGERREALGHVLLECLLRHDPDADEAVRAKALNAPLRAPLIIVVLAAITEHPKVPAAEQRLSAGCAAHSILLAAEALGYSGVWRTGNPAYDPEVVAALGGSRDEEIIAFLYVGTRAGTAKTLPAMSTDDFVARW